MVKTSDTKAARAYLSGMHRIITTCLAASAAIATGKNLNIATTGLRTDGSQNATPYVRRAVQEVVRSGGGIVAFPKGIYQFDIDGSLEARPYVSNNQSDFPKHIAIPLDGAKNLVIDGGGSLFVFRHKLMGITVENSSGVILRNFAMDYARPTHSDSTITEIRENDFTVKFEPEMTYRIGTGGSFRFVVDGEQVKDWSGYAFDGKTGMPKYRASENFGTPLANRAAEETAPGLVRFQGKCNSRYEVGDHVTFRHNNRNHVGIFIHKSVNTMLENVTIHHAAAMGVVGQRSTNISLDQVRVVPREGSGRQSTTTADATHFSGCRGIIKVTNSRFQGMMDDAINIHGTSLRIVEIKDDRSLVARFMHDQAKGFEVASPGDEIRFIDNATLLQIGDRFGKVEKADALDVNNITLTFAGPLPQGLKVGHAIENITWTPEVLFSGNRVEKNRARGMLFNTPRKCVVEKNFIHTSGSAILVAGDANGWFEGGAVGEFGPTIIRDNIFENCLINSYQFCNAVISIDPEIPSPSSERRYHRNIEISRNIFRVFDAPLIYARSVEGLAIKNNIFEKTEAFQPWHPNHAAIRLEYCRGVEISGNGVRGKLADTSISLKETPPESVTVAPGEPFRK